MTTSVIQGDSLNELFSNAGQRLLQKGNRSSSRNGDVTYLNNVVLELSDPRQRHLYIPGRKNNIFAVIAELFWVMSGSDEIDPFLSFYLPRAKDFSDDGKTWRGGYGPRLYDHDQLEQSIQMFVKEGLHTRRSVIDIYQSELDSRLYSEGTKDVPCNNMIHLYVDDGKLCMNVFSRSADLVWGVTNVNIPEWTFLQEYVAQRLCVPVGQYTHWCSNLHIYDFTANQVKESFPGHEPGINNKSCLFPKDVRGFFIELVKLYEDIVHKDRGIGYIHELFNKYGVLTFDNQLFDYATALETYTWNKAWDLNRSPREFNNWSSDFQAAIAASSFKNWD